MKRVDAMNEPHPRIRRRRIEVGFEAALADLTSGSSSRRATPADRLEQTIARRAIYAASAASQITEREQWTLHGYRSLLHGFLASNGTIQFLDRGEAARVLREVAEVLR